jgi:hypothetical protein
MARKMRVECAGTIYRVINRGDRRGAIFRNGRDGEGFLETLAQACDSLQVQGLCLVSRNNGDNIVNCSD